MAGNCPLPPLKPIESILGVKYLPGRRLLVAGRGSGLQGHSGRKFNLTVWCLNMAFPPLSIPHTATIQVSVGLYGQKTGEGRRGKNTWESLWRVGRYRASLSSVG